MTKAIPEQQPLFVPNVLPHDLCAVSLALALLKAPPGLEVAVAKARLILGLGSASPAYASVVKPQGVDGRQPTRESLSACQTVE